MTSKNAISDFGRIAQKPDNPQETLDIRHYYYSGFCAAEMTCSVIKAANHYPNSYYFTPDFTVSNADTKLLEEVNRVVMNGMGCISPIKGAYNLKSRGKENVRIALRFLKRYPILAGDLARNRIALLQEALQYLDEHRGTAAHAAKTAEMDRIRKALRLLKTDGVVEHAYAPTRVSKDAVGFFLAGVLDGEGSFGTKQSGDRKEPFVMMAMKDRKIVELLRGFVQYGTVRKRNDGAYHLEINKRAVLIRVCDLFLNVYPLRHSRQRKRMEDLQRILNDYTPSPNPNSPN